MAAGRWVAATSRLEGGEDKQQMVLWGEAWRTMWKNAPCLVATGHSLKRELSLGTRQWQEADARRQHMAPDKAPDRDVHVGPARWRSAGSNRPFVCVGVFLCFILFAMLCFVVQWFGTYTVIIDY